jgi:hypothetical protein
MKSLSDLLAEEDAKLTAAKASISEKDREEIAQRAELARKREERIKIEEEQRALDLARRLDAARERFADGALLGEVQVPNSAHNFIVKDPGAQAFNELQVGLNKVTVSELDMGKTKTTRAAVTRVYAVHAVVDWNGITDFSGATTNGHDLNEFLKAHPAIATQISNVAVDLAQSAAEARKS